MIVSYMKVTRVANEPPIVPVASPLPPPGRNGCDAHRYTGAMIDTPLLLMAVLAALLIAIALLVVLLRRSPEAVLESHRTRLEHALREEQREGRLELRQQLDSLASQQEQRIEGFGARLAELTVRTDQRLDVLRAALGEDARKGRAEHAESLRTFTST
ncbi:MAG: hypothetical protein KY442_12850, partial [Proteobacteria bacterium]|nr:hypothetical protein [Pseudomonadota bacterium]